MRRSLTGTTAGNCTGSVTAALPRWVLPHLAWSHPSSASCQVTGPEMEAALAYLAAYDTLAEASRCKFRLVLRQVIRSKWLPAPTQSAGEPALAKGDLRRRREEQRAEAIGREYRAKLDDLARQYATRVTVEWVRTLELAMPVQRFTVQVCRRKADRTIRLDWNPAARGLETPACEWSASAERPRLVCDDALHLVVAAALGYSHLDQPTANPKPDQQA